MYAVTSLLAAFFLNASDLSPVATPVCDSEGGITVVAGGSAVLPVVFPESDAMSRRAALYLAATIRDVTGVRPDVIPERNGHGVKTAALFVGSVSSARFLAAPRDDVEAFRVVTTNGSVHFLGRTDYAVYDWSERILDVRHHPTPPGLAGKCVVRRDTVVVPSADYSDRPVFALRRYYPIDREDWARESKCGGSHGALLTVHAPHRWYRDPDAVTNHPSIFALMPDGSRAEMPMLCYGNPETLSYYIRRIERHISGLQDSGGIVDPAHRVITVSPWDRPVSCCCEYCRRLTDRSLGFDGNASPIVWGTFLRKLAKWAKSAHPDYKIAFLPYLNTCLPPPGLDLSESGNCEAMVCTMPGLARLKDAAVRLHEENLIRRWAQVSGRKTISWHYACWPREFTTAPYLFGEVIVGHAMRMRDVSAGTMVCGGNASAAERLSAYVWLRTMWNPEIDTEAIYDRFARDLFGRSASPMRRLIAMQERGWCRPWARGGCLRGNIFGISYPPDEIAEMKRLVSDALSMSRDDPASLACVRWYVGDFKRFFREADMNSAGKGFDALEIAWTSAAPKVDGVIDDAVWRKVPERPLVSVRGNARPLRRKGGVRAAWNGDGVFFAVSGEEPEPSKLNLAAAYDDLQRQDTLELYVVSEPEGPCRRIMVDLRGRISWSSDGGEWIPGGARAAVSIRDQGWGMELFVPFSAMPKSESWKGNVIRWHAGGRGVGEKSLLSTLGGEWNQDRDAFSEFRFAAPGAMPATENRIGATTASGETK